MNKIHFVHTSDWHLGFTQYNKTQRYDDFRIAAEKTVDKIIELEPQFVIHTGDIFHRANPKPATIRQAVKVLSKLDRAGIPMYITRGNHDGNVSKYLKRGGGIISLLNDLQLLEFVDDEIIEINGTNVAFLGVGYYPGKQVANKIDQLMEENTDFLHSSKFKIIGIHAYVEGQIENLNQISLKQIRKYGVHYLGAGHYHIPWKDEERSVFAPGSSEITKISDAERMDVVDNVSMHSSFYEIKSEFDGTEWSELDIQTHQITVRPKILLNYTTELETVDEIKNELDEKLEEAKDTIRDIDIMLSMEAPILLVKLYTQLDFEQLNKIKIGEWYEDEYLHIISNVDGKTNTPQLNSDLGNSVIREDVIIELIEENGLNPEVHTNIIMEVLQYFADHSKSRSLNADVVRRLTSLFLQENASLQDIGDETPKEGVDTEEEIISESSEETQLEPDKKLPGIDSNIENEDDMEDEIMSIIGLDAFMEDDE